MDCLLYTCSEKDPDANASGLSGNHAEEETKGETTETHVLSLDLGDLVDILGMQVGHRPVTGSLANPRRPFQEPCCTRRHDGKGKGAIGIDENVAAKGRPGEEAFALFIELATKVHGLDALLAKGWPDGRGGGGASRGNG